MSNITAFEIPGGRGVMHRSVARRRLGSTGINIFSSELNVNGYSFRRSNFIINKGSTP